MEKDGVTVAKGQKTAFQKKKQSPCPKIVCQVLLLSQVKQQIYTEKSYLWCGFFNFYFLEGGRNQWSFPLKNKQLQEIYCLSVRPLWFLQPPERIALPFRHEDLIWYMSSVYLPAGISNLNQIPFFPLQSSIRWNTCLTFNNGPLKKVAPPSTN